MTDSLDEAIGLYPGLARYRKLLVSLAGTTVPLVIYLVTAPHTVAEIAAVVGGWVLTNLGVERATNE